MRRVEKYRGIMILPGSEEDLLTLQLDEDHPMFEHKKYEPNYEAMMRNGFLALLFLLCGVSAVAEWNRRDGGNMLFLVYGVFFFVGIYFFFKFWQLASVHVGYHVRATRALARVCSFTRRSSKDGTPEKTVLKLLVDTTGGYRYLYLDVNDPEWTCPIMGLVTIRAYQNHVRMDKSEEV